MKLIKILLPVLIISFYSQSTVQSQVLPKTCYYKDTLFEFVGFKIEIQKSSSNEKSFKSVIVITNTSDKFMIIDPREISGYISGDTDIHQAYNKKRVVITPHNSKAFTVKFVGKDFRRNVLSIDVSKIQLTDKVVSIIEVPEIDVSKENFREVGPLRWTVNKLNLGVSDGKPEKSHGGVPGKHDKKKDNFRIDATLEYSGNKFLGIFYNNIVLTTKDGGKFINVSKNSSSFSNNINKVNMDNAEGKEKQVLVFPIESEKIYFANEPKISFNGVFKEYSLETIEGFKVYLHSGTIDDYKGSNKRTKEIETMDEE